MGQQNRFDDIEHRLAAKHFTIYMTVYGGYVAHLKLATLFCLVSIEKPDGIDTRFFIVVVYIPDKGSSLKVQTDVRLELMVETDKFYYVYAVAQQYRYLYLVSVVLNVLYKRYFRNTIFFTAIAQNDY